MAKDLRRYVEKHNNVDSIRDLTIGYMFNITPEEVSQYGLGLADLSDSGAYAYVDTYQEVEKALTDYAINRNNNMFVVLNNKDIVKEKDGSIRDFGERIVAVPCTSLKDASKKVRRYIDNNVLGSSCFTGGDVYSGNELIARVSYNGRIWPINEGKERKFKMRIIESKNASSNVKINASDYDTLYTDIEGVFGERGVTISLGEMKEYWNEERDNDQVLSEYDSYDEWWADTEPNLELADNRFASGKYTLKVDTSGPEDHFSAPVGAEFGLRGKTICPFNKEGQEWIELCLDRRIPIGQDSLIDDDELDILFCDPNSGEVSDEIIEYLYDFEPLQESLNNKNRNLSEAWDESDLRSAVYNALTDVCYEFMRNGGHPTEDDMDEAIEWWQIHFWESDDAPEK